MHLEPWNPLKTAACWYGKVCELTCTDCVPVWLPHNCYRCLPCRCSHLMLHKVEHVLVIQQTDEVERTKAGGTPQGLGPGSPWNWNNKKQPCSLCFPTNVALFTDNSLQLLYFPQHSCINVKEIGLLNLTEERLDKLVNIWNLSCVPYQSTSTTTNH